MGARVLIIGIWYKASPEWHQREDNLARRTKLPKPNLGKLGQADFERWCFCIGLNAVKAVPDEFGWDYFVEFEPEVDEAIPLDRQNDLKKVLVQVKSTHTPSQRVRGKLSAFKYLVDSDLPTFFVHIFYSREQVSQRALLLHVGPTQIEAILRKVRQAEQAGRVDLQNINMSLELNEASTIAADGSNLRQLILDAVPRGCAEYAAAKASFRKSCGYNEHSIKAHFSLAPGLNEETLIDLLIGKAPSLPLSEIIVNKTRFGIALDKDIDRIREATLTVEVKPLQQGKLIARSAKRSSRVEMSVGIFAPGVPNLPRHLRKLRCANEFVDVVTRFSDDRAHMVFRIDPAKRYPLEALENALRFGLVLAEDDARIELVLEDDLPVISADSPDEARQFSRWRTLHEFIEVLSVALFRHRRGQAVEATLMELDEAFEANSNMFSVLARPGLEMKFSVREQIPRPIPTSGTIFVPTCIEFGSSLAYIAIVRIESKQIAAGEDDFDPLHRRPANGR